MDGPLASISSQAVTTILLTNDDGWNAPGLEALRQAARGLGDCRVIAPEEPHSGCGHRVTTHGPIRVRRPTADHVAVAGTPVDCVRLALYHLAPRSAGFSPESMPAATWALTFIIPEPWRPCAKPRSAACRASPYRTTSHEGGPIDWPRAARWARETLIVLMARAVRAGNVLERQSSLTWGPTNPIPKSSFARSILPPCPFPTISRTARPSMPAITSRESAGRGATSTSASAARSP